MTCKRRADWCTRELRNILYQTISILWYVDPLLRNDSEVSKYTIAVAK
jgi:hypothetical protein